MTWTFLTLIKRNNDENKSSWLSVVSDDTLVAVTPPGWGSSSREETSWTLTFPLPPSSHNIPLLVPLTRIGAGEENKASCCNILWGLWHHPTLLLEGWCRLCRCLFHFCLLQRKRAARQSTDDGIQPGHSWRGHQQEQPGGPDGAADHQTSAPLCQEGAQNTGGTSFREIKAWISANECVLIHPYSFLRWLLWFLDVQSSWWADRCSPKMWCILAATFPSGKDFWYRMCGCVPVTSSHCVF